MKASCRGFNIVTGHIQIMKKNYFWSSLCTQLRRYRFGVFAKRSTGIPLKNNYSRTKCIRKTLRAMMRISEILSRDDNSRVKSGIKASITRKGEKPKIRLLKLQFKDTSRRISLRSFLKGIIQPAMPPETISHFKTFRQGP